MAENYQVKQGDCISSIAFEKGFFPDTIWNHPDNKELKQIREDPNVLMPGDIVHIPDKRLKEQTESTNQVYKFKCKNVPALLNLTLFRAGEPIRNEPYVADIDGTISKGSVDSQGKVRFALKPNAKIAKLTVGTAEKKIEYVLDLRKLDPINEVIGFKKRLHDLGYDVGALDNSVTEEFAKAVRLFEAANDLEPTGQITENNTERLREVFGR